MTDPIPDDATCVFLFSPQHQRLCDQRRMLRHFYLKPDGTKVAYTKAITPGLPDTEAQITEYQTQFPDAQIAGYGTSGTKKVVSAAPTFAVSGPS